MPKHLNFESERISKVTIFSTEFKNNFCSVSALKFHESHYSAWSFYKSKCHLIVPENLFSECFLWFSAELFAYGGKYAECMSFGGFQQLDN